jgi:hypothetical protein
MKGPRCQRFSHVLGAYLLSGVALTFAAGEVSASVGLAEWEIYTPGGHLIAHSDVWKEQHGDCLLRDGGAQPLVSHLVRWRYYPGLVVGQTTSDFFLLDEKTETIARFRDQPTMEAVVRKRKPGPPSSDWLTASDGWNEAWFPQMVWPRCQQPADKLDAGTRATCDRALSPKGLAEMRARTWGRACRAALGQGGAGGSGGTPLAAQMEAWCKLVLGVTSGR